MGLRHATGPSLPVLLHRRKVPFQAWPFLRSLSRSQCPHGRPQTAWVPDGMDFAASAGRSSAMHGSGLAQVQDQVFERGPVAAV